MARPPLPIGERGTIKRTQLQDGTWQALCRFRDVDGVTRRVKATGPSGQKAENALKRKLAQRAHGTDDVTPETTIGDLAERWYRTVDKAPSTKDTYRRAIDAHILPGLRGVRIREATTGRMENFLSSVAVQTIRKPVNPKTGRQQAVRHGGPSAAKTCRSVLSMMMAMAVRFDAAEYNPVRETTQPAIEHPAARAMTVKEYEELYATIIAWEAAGRYGPARSASLKDKVALFMGTGVRPGELFAFRWEDVDFDSSPMTIEVSGTVNWTTEKKLHRQEYPKSESGERILRLPRAAETVLRRVHTERDPHTPNPLGLIFPSRAGTVIDPGNFRRQWREARGEKYAWVKPSSFRKTVATIIERESGSAVAAKQLGHAGDAVTNRHYVEKNRMAPDSSAILERFSAGQ